MIKIVLQILLISLPAFSFAQSSKKNYTILGTTKRLPLKNAKVYSYQGNGCSMGGLTLEPTDDSVFAVSSSIVCAVFDLGNGQIIVTKDDSLDRFYTYTNLREVFFSKGNVINKGSLIGLISREDQNFNEFVFMITNSKGMNFSDEKTWELINEDCAETLNSKVFEQE